MIADGIRNATITGADFLAQCDKSGGHSLDVIESADRATEPGSATGGTFTFTLLRDLKPRLDMRELVKGVIPAGGLGVAYAEPGAGKTAIIVDMGLHVAAGMPYRDRRIEQQPVIYIALEGHGGIGNRIIAAAKELAVEEAPFALVTATDNFRDPTASRRVAGVAKALGGQPLIVIDTLTAALHGGSDCNPEDVGALIEATKAELMAQGCTVLIIHHSGKDASRGQRGWSGLLGACDFELELSRDDDLRTMRVSKMRDGSDNQPALCYRLYPVELGVDQHGDPVTAVCVEHLADGDQPAKRTRMTPKARPALNELWNCIKDPSRSWPLSDQPGLKCTTLHLWEQACTAPGAVSKSGDIKQRRRLFREVVEELVAAGLVICDSTNGERVYPAPKEQG